MNNQEIEKETNIQTQEEIDNLQQESSDVLEVTEQEISEEVVENSAAKESKAKSAHEELISRVNATKEQANLAYENYLNIDKELEEKASTLAREENNIVKTTVANSLELLKNLQVDSLEDEVAAIEEIKVENKEQLLNVKYPSKGRFGGFFFGALTTVAGIAGAFAYGSKLANIPLSVNSFIDKANWNTVALKYAELINIKDNAIVGYAVVGVASLLLGGIVYKILTILKGSKNRKYVNKLESDLSEYTANIEAKTSATKELIEHIDNIKLVMQKYDIILQEQNAKLKRMLFIEQPENVDNLQRASKLEVDKTVLILDELLKLMNTPVSEDVNIKEESQEQLKEANGVINEIIKKLYI